MLTIAMISYLPDDPEIRKSRIKSIELQYKFLTEEVDVDPSCVNVVAQNWKDDLEYLPYKVEHYDKPLGPSKARNIILEAFYKSDSDWLWCMDDDISFYDYYEIGNIVKELHINPEKFKEIDSFTGVFPQYYPFKKQNLEDPNLMEYYTFIPRPINTGGGCLFMKNIKKYKDKEIYYRDIDMQKFAGREDMSFLVDWLKAGLNAYQCNQLILKNHGGLGSGKSTLFSADEKEYKEQVDRCMDNFLKLHGIRRGLNGQIRWNEFNVAYNRSRLYYKVKREEPIKELDESLKTVQTRMQKNEKQRRLF